MNSRAPPIRTPAEVAARILAGRPMRPGPAFAAAAPVNIALVKYWGKRDEALNLPVTSSLSISLAGLDTETEISAGAFPDSLRLDGIALQPGTTAHQRLASFLDLFRPAGMGFRVESANRVPTAAGLAPSAAGFAALVRALDGLFGWRLPARDLSILARLGSGSACRSVFSGFVEWRAGEAEDGMDSHAVPLPDAWPELRIGLWILQSAPKPMSSREAMRRAVRTSPLYRAWPRTVEADLRDLRSAIIRKDFERLGGIAEGNALAMHAVLAAARPSVLCATPETCAALARIRRARKDGVALAFTMDAGPNVKLLFLEKDRDAIRLRFPEIRAVETGPPDREANSAGAV